MIPANPFTQFAGNAVKGLVDKGARPSQYFGSYRKMMINQDTACMFACCYDDKGGHLPAHSAKPAIFQ